MTKTCLACGVLQPVGNFYLNPTVKSGREASCKKCRLVRTRRQYYSNIERSRELSRESSRRRAKIFGHHPYATQRQRKAQRAVQTALENGVLRKPDKCMRCSSEMGPIEAHHDDYSELISVIWLCRSCHRAADKLRRDSESGLTG